MPESEKTPRLNRYIRTNKTIHVDIPVKLTEVKLVSIASLSFEGDLPAPLFHMGLIVDDMADWNDKSQVIAVFHTNAGHVTLYDTAYNADRDFTTGNPYKGMVGDLIKHGAKVELCGATAISQLRRCGFTPRHQDQYRRHVANDSACPAL